ncbi:TonB-dependent receptor plug domain-containing protein [Riemerella anatipestifer]|nr:TonB-dependent receptor plug domain-containing protein [Riemerella anatipestifer]QYR05668.1 TonB-dependent receptor plug domain-containing protein [Riemerella anatipestifer]
MIFLIKTFGGRVFYMIRLVLLTSLSSVFFVQAQQKETVIDTVAINLVSPTSLSVGHEVVKIDLKNNPETFIEGLLQKQTGAVIRNYGYGNLASVSIKGLSPSQHLFTWEGIPINSSLNGQVDANIISSNLNSNLTYRSGSGSSGFGSGALGGVFALEFNPNFNEQTQYRLENTLGSFGLSRNSFSVQNNTSRWSWNAGVNYLRSDNEFPFRDKFGKKGKTRNSGFDIADIYLNSVYKLSGKHKISFNIWNQWASRNVGATEAQPIAQQIQDDESTRMQVSWFYHNRGFEQQLQSAYTKEFFRFRMNAKDGGTVSFAENYFANYIAKLAFSKSLVKLGLQSKYTTGGGDNLRISPLKEWHSFVNYRYNFNDWSVVSANLRKSFSSLFSIPITYDVGLELEPLKHLSIKASYATSYRLPTFNDLYWKQGGNPLLKPEAGKMGELSVGYKYKNTQSVGVSVHYGEVRDWILWYPNDMGFWTPTNLDFVITKGGQARSSHRFVWGGVGLNFNNLLTYTETYNQRTQKSLIYIPRWNYSNTFSLDWKKYHLELEHLFTSERATDQINRDFLAPYHLWNVGLGFDFKLKNISNSLNIRVQNILDQSYNTMQGYPMPGRYFLTTLKTNF